MSETEEPTFPPIEFVRRGPPVSVKDLHRQQSEKWARIMMVTPRPLETSERVRYDFVERGPLTLPLAVRREDSDAGSRDAWKFFTHPYAVFPDDATFYNVAGNGCLGARIFVRTDSGVQLYDEVGAGIAGSQRVSDSFHGALGLMRHMALGDIKTVSDSPLALDLFELDIDLLELFNLTVQLLRDENPSDTLSRLYPHLLKPSVHHFAWDAFDESEHDIMRKLADGETSAKEVQSTFRVIRRDFTRIADVKDAQGRQTIVQQLNEWSRFEDEHGHKLQELSTALALNEQNLADIKAKVAQLQEQAEHKSRVTRFFSRSDHAVKQLKAEAVRAVRTRRELEETYDTIPGYAEFQGLSERVKDFESEIRRIFDMSQNMIQHTVSKDDIDGLRAILKEKILPEEEFGDIRPGFRQYDLRLRAEVIPKLLQTYSLSAYVLRRPDALVGKASRRNLRRINDLALRLIEYFRYVRYGKTTVGEAYDETWGQVVSLEAQL